MGGLDSWPAQVHPNPNPQGSQTNKPPQNAKPQQGALASFLPNRAGGGWQKQRGGGARKGKVLRKLVQQMGSLLNELLFAIEKWPEPLIELALIDLGEILQKSPITCNLLLCGLQLIPSDQIALFVFFVGGHQ